MTERSKTFCIVPWTQVATNSTGNYRICCNALPGKNLVLSQDGKPEKIYKKSVTDIWNSKTYTDLRSQFLKGEKPEMCTRCFREEEAGVISARQRNNKRWFSDYEDQTEIPLDVKYIDLRLGNLCNLKCRMCNPYASSKWVDEWNSVIDSAELVPNFKLKEDEADRLKQINWPQLDITWKNLEPLMDNIEEIYFTGGEPFLSLEQKRILKRLIECDKAKNIIVKYNTNLTIVPEELAELWPHFKKIRMNCSVDGVGPLNDYIRFPSKWEIIEENMERLSKIEKVDLGFHTTVQIYNILSLDKLINYFETNYNIVPYFNILNHPQCLNIRVLPDELKALAVKRLKNFLTREEVQEVVRYMNKESWTEKYFKEFKKYTLKMDNNRSESILNLVEELNDYF